MRNDLRPNLSDCWDSNFLLGIKSWCPGAESNHRHRDFQSRALPTELPGRRPASNEAAAEARGVIKALPRTVQNGPGPTESKALDADGGAETPLQRHPVLLRQLAGRLFRGDRHAGEQGLAQPLEAAGETGERRRVMHVEA